jgi:hypothetical protein
MARLIFACSLCVVVTALSQQESTSSRRAFLGRLPVAASAISMAGVISAGQQQHAGNCRCDTCQFSFGVCPAGAYERRDVGGDTRSAETAALNEQAYQTQSRLEKEGFKIETEAEQKASLTAALSDYSYSPSTSKIDKNKPKGKASQSDTRSPTKL